MAKIFTRFIVGIVLFILVRLWIKNTSRTVITPNNNLTKTRRSVDSTKQKPLRARRIFISHSWQLSSRDYYAFVKNLRAIRFIYNHSIPRKKARHVRDDEDLHNVFRKQMLWCSKIFVLADRDLPFDSYVLAEMDIASELGKEIIAIQPNIYHPIPHFIRRRAHHIIANDVREIKRVLG
jgi:hypothetical protein